MNISVSWFLLKYLAVVIRCPSAPAKDVQHFLLPWTKQYLAVFSAILSSYDKITSAAEFGLVREILSVLTKLLNAFPHHMSQEVQVALQPAWTILVTSCQLYVTSCVNSIQDTHGLEGEEGGLTSDRIISRK